MAQFVLEFGNVAENGTVTYQKKAVVTAFEIRQAAWKVGFNLLDKGIITPELADLEPQFCARLYTHARLVKLPEIESPEDTKKILAPEYQSGPNPVT